MEICRNFELCPLVCFDAGVNFVGDMATSQVLIFWSMMTRLFFLRSSSRSHFKLSNVDDTLSVLLYLFVTCLAALLSTFSIALDSNFSPGDHTVDAYSKIPVLVALMTYMPSILLSLAAVFTTCWFHDRSLAMMIPK